MFCYQCEQTAKGTGCTAMGVCGKDATTAALQDLLVHAAKGVSAVAHAARPLGVIDPAADLYVVEALFMTVTNVNFDPADIVDKLAEGKAVRDALQAKYAAAGGVVAAPAWTATTDVANLVAQGRSVGIDARLAQAGPDVTALGELLIYGLKGMAAYVDHAQILGKEDPDVYAFIHRALAVLAAGNADANTLLGLCLECGQVNLTVMGMLDAAHIEHFGSPQPTAVRVEPVAGKAILVSGHDLLDLEALLQQTAGTGINVYTHGEMLPAHGYPGLKKYPHLAGNYGGAWQDQQKEFAAFPGAILMTTNCIQKPRDSYKDRLFTAGLVGWPGVRHVHRRDFSQVIAAARAADGFAADGPDTTILVGFGHDAVLGVADKVIEAVKAGAVRHFFLIGGCDGAKPGRNYYTELAEAIPDDCVILTLACGKFRFFDKKLGDIGGIPRLLDVGQCNDAYSAIQIAVALAKAFDCSVNDLPLSLVLSWFEQKAVVILLSLLHLGITNIRLGPSLPAFVTPAMLDILVDKFNIMPITTAQEDLQAILG
ncbi:MAG: hydroxylamine reductase [Planctomycetes bacterium]|nr:hydroxylamine reductase [Planctomycetota bacterium]